MSNRIATEKLNDPALSWLSKWRVCDDMDREYVSLASFHVYDRDEKCKHYAQQIRFWRQKARVIYQFMDNPPAWMTRIYDNDEEPPTLVEIESVLPSGQPFTDQLLWYQAE